MVHIIEEEVKTFDTNKWANLCAGSRDRRRFIQSTNEPYRLLIHLAHQYLGALFYDVGTRRGASAIALASKPDNKVITWDTDPSYRQRGGYAWPDLPECPNLEFRIKSIFDEPATIYDNVDIINLDVDPHDGIKERKFMSILKDTKFSGILILDDINHRRFPSMKIMWEEIDTPYKYVIPYAHGSGTGIISYGKEIQIA